MKVFKFACSIFSVIFILGLPLALAGSDPASFLKDNGAMSTEPMINDLRINDDTGTAEQYGPAIAMNKYGYSVVCWEDRRSGSSRIYMQLYGDKGFAIRNNIEVCTMSGTMRQQHPDVAMNDLGHFIVVWTDTRNDYGDIYAQMYTANAFPKTFSASQNPLMWC